VDPDSGLPEAQCAAAVALLEALGTAGAPFECAAVAPWLDVPVPAVASAARAALARLAGAVPGATSPSDRPLVRVLVRSRAAGAECWDIRGALRDQCAAAGLEIAPQGPVHVVLCVDYAELPGPSADAPSNVVAANLLVLAPAGPRAVGPLAIELIVGGTGDATARRAGAVAALTADGRFAAAGALTAAAAGVRGAAEPLWPKTFTLGIAPWLAACPGEAPADPAMRAWWCLARGDWDGVVTLGDVAGAAFTAYLAAAPTESVACARVAGEARLAAALGDAAALPLLRRRLELLPPIGAVNPGHAAAPDEAGWAAEQAALGALCAALATLTPAADRPTLLTALRPYLLDEREDVVAAARAACTTAGGDPDALAQAMEEEMERRFGGDQGD